MRASASQTQVSETSVRTSWPIFGGRPQAVALLWRGERIGYVPRRLNAEITRRLDAREALV
jgi:hypothetical protein